MQPVHGTLWEPWEALLYLEYCGVLDELDLVTLPLPLTHPSADGPSELFWRKGGSRGRAEAQEHRREHRRRRTTKTRGYHEKSFWSQIPLAHASESTKRVWAHAGERAKMRSRNLCVAMGYELDDKEILGGRSPNSQNR